ncbi:sugar dehydrogenase complex small subunit [Paraburkholderia pallida]|uniref:Sorbitol dehydrogenase n=1 Tax=Paraburkholderia pallida TaxID=2547399 RepID=A0A4P7CRY0_9BURK|nr:sugar dehydrogenase complex small subunit [Paraburkholderia pallida]QBQ98680.1 sorbitol dehydrogenase [Paraburkholderia pallida]
MTDVTQQDGTAHSPHDRLGRARLSHDQAARRAARTEAQPGTSEPDGPVEHAGRRRFVTLACATAATLAFALAGRRGAQSAFGIADALAANPAADPAASAAAAESGYAAFIALSQHLTGRTHFDAVLGQRIYAALARASSQFEQNVGALNAWLKAHGGVPSDTVTAALKADQPELASSVGDIMRAWYLGLVGEMPNVQVLAYEKALMFDPVSDVLTIPSYCRDVPFYWTKKPADMPATTVAAMPAARN